MNDNRFVKLMAPKMKRFRTVSHLNLTEHFLELYVTTTENKKIKCTTLKPFSTYTFNIADYSLDNYPIGYNYVYKFSALVENTPEYPINNWVELRTNQIVLGCVPKLIDTYDIFETPESRLQCKFTIVNEMIDQTYSDYRIFWSLKNLSY